MRKLETVLISTFILGLILFVFRLRGANFLLILSLGSLSVVYTALGAVLFRNKSIIDTLSHLEQSYSPVSGFRFRNIGIGAAFGVASIGILFKLLSWPGESLMLLFGILGTGIVTMITLKSKRKEGELSKKSMFRRIALFGGLCLLLFALPTKTWLNFKYPDNPEYVQAVLDMQKDPNNDVLRAKVKEERKKLR